MLPAPSLNLLHVLLAMKVARVLPAPLPLARQLAGRPTGRIQTEALMPGIAPAWPEPNPTVTTLSQPIRAHRLLPEENREEYDNHGLPPVPFTPAAATAADALRAQKNEEDAPFGSGGRREEDESFRSAEEESFQTGVEKRS